MQFVNEQFVGAGVETGAARQAEPQARQLSAGTAGRYESHADWLGTRSFEGAETTRLNKAHWQQAQDRDVNLWLVGQLAILRGRATYESRNNPMLSGIGNSLADDVVGPDGPILSILSDDDAYNDALAEAWRQWFRAPTFRPNVSGTAWLKLCVRNLPKCGEFMATIGTDMQADGPVKMRIRPRHPRWMASPDGGEYPRRLMGVERDANDRPTRYWFMEREGMSYRYDPYSPDDVIHEFIADEEEQLRGYPWLSPALQPAADLRDFDEQTLDAARQEADNSALLYTEHPDAPVWTAPESTEVERRTIKMAPPGWKPFQYSGTSPPVQYPDYRLERHRELGRPFNMPVFMVRLDSSNHNYSSVRMDAQGWAGFVAWIQYWLSGTPDSVGLLSRLLDMVAAEARFSVPALRNRPAVCMYEWTWPQRPHVDPKKESEGEKNSLYSGTEDGVSALARRGQTLKRHVAAQRQFVRAYEEADLPLPAWAQGQQPPADAPSASDVADLQDQQDEAAANAK